jgi:hypothetical protein
VDNTLGATHDPPVAGPDVDEGAPRPPLERREHVAHLLRGGRDVGQADAAQRGGDEGEADGAQGHGGASCQNNNTCIA